MSEQTHPWSHDPSRDAAARREEPVRESIQHRDLPEAVAALTRRVEGLETVAKAWRQRCEREADAGSVTPPREAAQDSRPAVNAEGLRTERVTKAIDLDDHAEAFAELERERPDMDDDGLQWANAALEAGRYAIERLTAERDAAIRERDEARAECKMLLAERDEATGRCKMMLDRVAELEAAAKLAPGANAGGDSNQPEPRGWLTTAEEREAIRWAIQEARGRANQWTVGDQLGFGKGNRVSGHADTLRSLLARSTPPRVRRPNVRLGSFPKDRDEAWIAAIREAGGEVEE